MNIDPLHIWARELLEGHITASELRHRLLRHAAADLGHTLLDTDRKRRCGFPEVVFGPGKSPEELVAIAESYRHQQLPLLITRIDQQAAGVVGSQLAGAYYNSLARTLRWKPESASPSADSTTAAHVAVLTAGTSDRPVAEEALETLAWMNVPARAIWDVGVAGPLRLWSRLGELEGAACVIAVAGMEGALPSVVGGWVSCPVIAVPTSVGYGANLQGITALLGMLIGCAANVAVVNIDAGFKAGYLAGLIATRTRAGTTELPQ